MPMHQVLLEFIKSMWQASGMAVEFSDRQQRILERLTAADGLAELQKDLAERGVRLGLARVKQDLLLPLQRAGLMELIGTDMLFPTLPVAEKAYLVWAAENPYVPPPLPIEPADEDDTPVWNVYRFSEEAHQAHDETEPGVVAKATHAALARAHQAAAAVTSAITSLGDASPSDPDTLTKSNTDADTDPSSGAGSHSEDASSKSADLASGPTPRSAMGSHTLSDMQSQPESSAAPAPVKAKTKVKHKAKGPQPQPGGGEADAHEDEDGILAGLEAHPS